MKESRDFMGKKTIAETFFYESSFNKVAYKPRETNWKIEMS